jgi:arylformamidase
MPQVTRTALPPTAIQTSLRALPTQRPLSAPGEAYGHAALALFRLAAMTTPCALDIPYGSDSVQRLDIYTPGHRVQRKFPVFIDIHGGNNTHGYKEWMGLNAPAITSFPAILVSPDYRLLPSPSREIASQLEDCLLALRWVVRNIEHYHGDPTRIYVGGHSAGAKLAALVTLREDLYSRYELPRNCIQGCFPVSGSYDTVSADELVDADTADPSSALLQVTDVARECTPMQYVGANRVPFFVAWSENDFPRMQSEGPKFVRALLEKQVRAESHVFPALDHYWIHIDQQRSDNAWTRTLKRWMHTKKDAA